MDRGSDPAIPPDMTEGLSSLDRPNSRDSYHTRARLDKPLSIPRGCITRAKRSVPLQSGIRVSRPGDMKCPRLPAKGQRCALDDMVFDEHDPDWLV